MRAQDLSIYRKAVRTKDGRLPPPEPVLGDSVMSGRLLISGRHLILTISWEDVKTMIECGTERVVAEVVDNWACFVLEYCCETWESSWLTERRDIRNSGT